MLNNRFVRLVLQRVEKNEIEKTNNLIKNTCNLHTNKRMRLLQATK